jgi:hypothetical protein
MASRIVRVPSTSGMPVVLRSSDGPMAFEAALRQARTNVRILMAVLYLRRRNTEPAAERLSLVAAQRARGARVFDKKRAEVNELATQRRASGSR